MKIQNSIGSVLGFVLVLLCAVPTLAQTDQDEVKKVILDGYVNGAFNSLDPAAMRKSFHEDFAIYSPDGVAISKYPIATWVEGTEKRKSSDKFDPTNNKWDHKFVTVDVTGTAAMVKIELSNKGKHVYTDYLSLLKFDNGWRIVAKVYNKHQ